MSTAKGLNHFVVHESYQNLWYNLGMKVKTSVTLDENLLNRIDGLLSDHETRSAFFHDAVTQLADKRERALRDAKDLDILNSKAAELNEEALDNLTFVSDLFTDQGLDHP